jgi:hypothetical protein
MPAFFGSSYVIFIFIFGVFSSLFSFFPVLVLLSREPTACFARLLFHRQLINHIRQGGNHKISNILRLKIPPSRPPSGWNGSHITTIWLSMYWAR